MWLRLPACLLGNLLALVLSIPILSLVVLAAALARSPFLLLSGTVLFLGILPNPATAGLQAMMHGAANREPLVGIGEQMAGLRAYWFLALRAWILSAIITVFLIGNVAFYAGHSTPASRALAVLFLALFPVWLSVHLLLYPILLELDEPRILLAYRNAAVIVIAHPFTVMLASLLWICVLTITSMTGIVGLIGLAIGAGIQQHAGYRLLKTFGRKSG